MSEKNIYNAAIKLTLGLDEAGRGCFAGPVVAAVVAFNRFDLPPAEICDNLADSKTLTSKKRRALFNALIAAANLAEPKLAYGVGVVDNYRIDEINILQATFEAMQRALNEIYQKIDSRNINTIVIDGRGRHQFQGLPKAPLFLVDADAKIPEVQAASIIAKVFRDRLMETYAELYPQHHFQHHKGYGTRQHRAVINHKSRLTGIHRLSYQPVARVLNSKPRLLLHVCCGPDACIPIVDLKQNYEIIAFWYDPNIQPRDEYQRRRQAFAKVCQIEGIEWHEGEYDTANFFQAIRGLEMTPERGEKCTKCYDQRLTRSILKAKELNCDFWTTTLNMSPKKDFEKLTHIGFRLQQTYGLPYLALPFRKNNGFNRAVAYTQANEIFRQTYCGCIFSDTYPGISIKKRLQKNGQTAKTALSPTAFRG